MNTSKLTPEELLETESKDVLKLFGSCVFLVFLVYVLGKTIVFIST
jgi:hypothetical protein